ncbi:MAG: HDIG domain-containing protein [Prevotellaceae bacterium]|jgi:putative nucleotidyltransferase with HDIG domain|nr:HDIG domain-containing protein [Prevotellaceae bacterium]
MTLKFTQKNIRLALKVVLFLCLGIAAFQLFPRNNRLNYFFEEGKPWSYDIVTAPFKFSIYKPAKEVKVEREKLLSKFVPYFLMDTAVVKSQTANLANTLRTEPEYIQQLLYDELRRVYKRGIISIETLRGFQQENRTKINFIYPDRKNKEVLTSSLYSPKTAYESILQKYPHLTSVLNDYNLNLFLSENLKYDSLASESSKKDLLKGLSLTTGMIQAGEKIISRGEIVTPYTFAVLTSLNKEYEIRNSHTQQTLLEQVGEVLLIAVFITLLFLFIYVFRPRYFDSFKNLLLIAIMMLLIIAATALLIRNSELSIYIVPFTLLPVIIRVFFDSRTALFSHIITVLLLSLIVDNPFQFVVLQITAGMTAVSNMKDLTQRSQLAQTAFYVFVCYFVTFIGLEFITEGQSLAHIYWIQVLFMAGSAFLVLFAYILIYFTEKVFGLVSSITLVELTNTNSDFMMDFAEKAPGTFQHTLQVSNLATEAAKAINANALLVRTGALYHDVGKKLHPEYFTENQAGGNNPLLKLDLKDAAKLIINHVADGLQIAKKEHLPEQIINFIGTHHGTSKTKYFYNAFINANPGVSPDDAAFTYPGPRPNTKETAILMMVDAVEARSHSLTEYTVESIDAMVENMIDIQIADGQFKDAPISFLDVEKVKAVLKEKIKSIYHTRIVYPEVKTTE